jgi:DNA-directed RNA polymerase subunit M/transcription elongation factor TFIIS
MSSEHMECSECGATMLLDNDKIMLVCPFCGNREPLDPVTASRLNAQDNKEILNQAEKAISTKARTVKKAGAKTIKRITLVVIALFVVFAVAGLAINAAEEEQLEKTQQERLNATYTWPESGLAKLLPQPEQTTGYIYTNSASSFEINVPCTSESEWTAYVARLKLAGFTIDPTSYSSSYTAYNEQGYSASVDYWEYSKPAYMEIRINEPLTAREIVWPTVGVGSLLPTPPSLLGTIETDSSDSFRALITQMTTTDFSTYCTTCINAGFNKDYNRQDTCFYGYDNQGNHLTVEYRGYNIVEISVYAESN